MTTRWLRRLLRIHSPSGHVLGTCWCQPKPTPFDDLAQKIAAHNVILLAYLARITADPGLDQEARRVDPPTDTR